MIFETPKEALEQLKKGNKIYVSSDSNPADQFQKIRLDTANNGQHPYAVVLTCSDSRVPAEHIFSAGIGDLFTVRTAGNVISDFEIGSIEYGCAHLGAKVVLVMGHTHCGAINAALKGGADGFIQKIVDEIKSGLNGADTEITATDNNIIHSADKLMDSSIIRELVDRNQLLIVPAKYDIETGEVAFSL